MLLAIGANELGSRFGPVPGARAFHRAYLFLGLGEWVCAPIFLVCAPIFKPYQQVFYCIHQSDHNTNNKQIKNNKFKHDPINNHVT